MRFIRSLPVAMWIILLVTAPVSPASAQASPDLVQGFVDTLNQMAGAEADLLEWATVPESAGSSDAQGDLFTLENETPTFAPAYVDLLGSDEFATPLPKDVYAAMFGENGLVGCDRAGVSCPRYETKTVPFQEGVFIVGFQLAADATPTGTEALTVAVLATDDDYPTAQDPRPASPFAGTNKVWRLDVSADGAAVAYLQIAGGAFQEFHTDARVLLDGDRGWFLIPPVEFPLSNTITGFRVHTNAVPEPGAAVNGQAADVDGGATSPSLTEPVGQTGEIRLSPPPEPEPSPSPSQSPSTTAASPTTAEAEESAFDEGNDGIWWVLIGVGTGLVFTGLLWWARTRTRDKEDLGPPGPGQTQVREPPPPPASTPKKDPPVEFAFCDWAVKYLTAAGPKVLRPAKGPECCVYTISVQMKVEEHQVAARGRQEGVVPGAPRARLRIPSLTLEPNGLGGRVEAAVRSGPAEDLGWMQGLGEPTEPEEVGRYRQLRSHEEPPDVAAHVSWVVAHVVQVTLESMCPGHVNRFNGLASSRIQLNADIECTNQGPPECPVEFSAEGWVRGAVGIFMDYEIAEQLGSDPDEIEPVAPPGTPFHAITDLHDHERRDRLHYETEKVANNEASLEGDFLWATFETGLVGDAGTIIPQAVWPSTGRVTATVGSTVEHGATFDAQMSRVDCIEGSCCGYTGCRCEPKLQIRFAGNRGIIEVDGTSHVITPDPPPPGGARGWALG